jgi:DNA-binding transcriptional LysR family regulator
MAMHRSMFSGGPRWIGISKRNGDKVNLRFVEAFVWVARLKSITRGAEKLCLTQSAVSNRIASLEEELGVLLLDRRNPGFRLSNAGTRFLDYADRLLALQRELKNELGSTEQHPFSLRVGAIETVLHTWLIPLVDRLKKVAPRIEFELTIEMTPLLNEQIKRGALDLVFSALPAIGDGIVNDALRPLEMVFIGPISMAGKAELSLEEILDQDIMTFQRGSQPHVALIDALRVAGAGDKHVHSMSSISALTSLVESGFGIATLPKVAALRLMNRNRICILSTVLTLAPLPMYANYWSDPAASILKQATDEALALARNFAGEPETSGRSASTV